MNYPISPEARHLAASHLLAARAHARNIAVAPRYRWRHCLRQAAPGLLLELHQVTRQRVRDEIQLTALYWSDGLTGR